MHDASQQFSNEPISDFSFLSLLGHRTSKWVVVRKQGNHPVRAVAGTHFRLKKRAQKEANSLNKNFKDTNVKFVVRKEAGIGNVGGHEIVWFLQMLAVCKVFHLFSPSTFILRAEKVAFDNTDRDHRRKM